MGSVPELKVIQLTIFCDHTRKPFRKIITFRFRKKEIKSMTTSFIFPDLIDSFLIVPNKKVYLFFYF